MCAQWITFRAISPRAIQEQLTMRETEYYDNNLSTNAHTDIYSTYNARKILEGKPALAIPMRALQCTRITVQKQVRPHGTSAPMVRKHMIPLRALTFNLDPSLRTYVFPFLLRRMRFSFSVNNFHFLSICEMKENYPLTMRAQEPKWPKRVILADCAYGDSEIMRLWVSQCADKSCAHIVYSIYVAVCRC